MEFVDILGLVAGICTSSSVIPQIITTIKKKKAAEVSLVMFIVLMTGNALWIYYGTKQAPDRVLLNIILK
jgi:MtN3 and saliva related transmembrane protein